MRYVRDETILGGMPREKVENCRPSLRFSVPLCPVSGEVLLKRTGRYDKKGQNLAQDNQAGHVTFLLFLWACISRS